jgi:hypothetical protein
MIDSLHFEDSLQLAAGSFNTYLMFFFLLIVALNTSPVM